MNQAVPGGCSGARAAIGHIASGLLSVGKGRESLLADKLTCYRTGEYVFLYIQYVQGYETPAQFYVKLTPSTIQHNITGILGTSGCLENIPAGSYSVSVTDADAVATIDTQPAVTQGGIVVPVRPWATTETSVTTNTSSTTGKKYKIELRMVSV